MEVAVAAEVKVKLVVSPMLQECDGCGEMVSTSKLTEVDDLFWGVLGNDELCPECLDQHKMEE